MDIIQKRVLHKKSFFLAEYLQLTENFLKEAVRQGLILQHDINLIQTQHDNLCKMSHFISSIVKHKGPVFDKFCFLLERTSYGDLSDELKAEVTIDTDETVPNYIYKECDAVLEAPLSRTVKGRRVLNKDELLKIVARRFFTGKEIGVLQAKRRIAEINKEKLSILDDIEKVEKVLDNILALYGATAVEILNKGKGSSTGDSLYYGPQGPVISYTEKLKQLENKAKSITGAYHDMVDEHREFVQERSRCFYLLGFGNSPTPNRAVLKMKLDLELQDVLATSSVELDKRRLDVVSKQDMAKELDVELNSLKLEMDRKTKYMKRENGILSDKLADRDDELTRLSRLLDEKVRFIRVQQTKMDSLVKRCEMLESTRRIGYFSDQINSTNTQQPDVEYNKNLFEMECERAKVESRPSSVCSRRSDSSTRSTSTSRGRRKLPVVGVGGVSKDSPANYEQLNGKPIKSMESLQHSSHDLSTSYRQSRESTPTRQVYTPRDSRYRRYEEEIGRHNGEHYRSSNNQPGRPNNGY